MCQKCLWVRTNLQFPQHLLGVSTHVEESRGCNRVSVNAGRACPPPPGFLLGQGTSGETKGNWAGQTEMGKGGRDQSSREKKGRAVGLCEQQQVLLLKKSSSRGNSMKSELP